MSRSEASAEMAWSSRDEAILMDGEVQVLDGRTIEDVTIVTINQGINQMQFRVNAARNIAEAICSEIHEFKHSGVSGDYLKINKRSGVPYIAIENCGLRFTYQINSALILASRIFNEVAMWQDRIKAKQKSGEIK